MSHLIARALGSCLALAVMTAAVPALAGPAAPKASAKAAAPTYSEDKALSASVNGAWRSAENKARDAHRHPVESLTFWGLRPGQSIVEISPGARGWWTEILAPYARMTGGSYSAALSDRSEAGISEAAQKAREAQHKAFWDGVADTSLYGQVKAYDFGPKSPNSIPAGSADMVLVARAFHSWARQGDLTDTYMSAFFTMLKPGGVLAVEQHRALEGADPKAGNGYVPESYVIAAAQKAGFVLDGKSEVNANPKDTRDHPFGVWTLPPVRQSAASGQQPAADFDRAKYDAIGESDRMTLRFRKPKS